MADVKTRQILKQLFLCFLGVLTFVPVCAAAENECVESLKDELVLLTSLDDPLFRYTVANSALAGGIAAAFGGGVFARSLLEAGNLFYLDKVARAHGRLLSAEDFARRHHSPRSQASRENARAELDDVLKKAESRGVLTPDQKISEKMLRLGQAYADSRGNSSSAKGAIRQLRKEMRGEVKEIYGKPKVSLKVRAKAGAGASIFGIAGGVFGGFYLKKKLGLDCGGNSSLQNGEKLAQYFTNSIANGCSMSRTGALLLLNESPGELAKICKENPKIVSSIQNFFSEKVKLYKDRQPPTVTNLDCSTNQVNLEKQGRKYAVRFEFLADGNMKVMGHLDSRSSFSAIHTEDGWRKIDFNRPVDSVPESSRLKKNVNGRKLIEKYFQDSDEGLVGSAARAGEQLFGLESIRPLIAGSCKSGSSMSPPTRAQPVVN